MMRFKEIAFLKTAAKMLRKF